MSRANMAIRDRNLNTILRSIGYGYDIKSELDQALSVLSTLDTLVSQVAKRSITKAKAIDRANRVLYQNTSVRRCLANEQIAGWTRIKWYDLFQFGILVRDINYAL